MDLIMNKDFYWRMLTILCAICVIVSVCDVAFATSNDVIGTTLCRLVSNLSGGIAKSVATMAIFAVGIGLFMGKLSWGTAALTAAGVGVIFGAAKLVSWLGGTDVSTACTG